MDMFLASDTLMNIMNIFEILHAGRLLPGSWWGFLVPRRHSSRGMASVPMIVDDVPPNKLTYW